VQCCNVLEVFLLCNLFHIASTGPYPRANIVMKIEKFTSINNRMESRKVRNENVFFDTFFVYIFDFIYLDLNINKCTVRRESVNCSVLSGVI